MFSATKLLVAGAIVALFGGFLLAGVLTQQPSDEVVPAVGASASPSDATPYAVTVVPSPGFAGHRSVATDDALWVINAGRGVSRIDAKTGDVAVADEFGTPIRWLVPAIDGVWAVDTFNAHHIDGVPVRPGELTVSDSIRRSRGQPLMWESSCFGPMTADGSLWIAAPGSESHTLIEIDIATRSIRDEYVADEDWSSGGCGPWMDVIGDAIWVHSKDPATRGRRLTRFDLGTREFTDRIEVPTTQRWCCSTKWSIVSDDAIWLIDQPNISRFDPSTLSVTETLALGGHLTGGIAAAGAIWVSGYGSDTDDSNEGVVYRIDPVLREVTDVITVGIGPERPAFLHGAIWVANHSDKSMSRIDPESRQVTDTVVFPVKHLHTPLASDGVIWAYTENGEILRVDGPFAVE